MARSKLGMFSCLDADAITAETIGAQTIPRLQKRQGHPLRLFAWAIHPADAFNHLENRGLITTGRINQHCLRAGHAQRGAQIVRQKAVGGRGHGLSRLRISRNSTDPLSILQVILNKRPRLRTFLNCGRHLLVGVQHQRAEQLGIPLNPKHWRDGWTLPS